MSWSMHFLARGPEAAKKEIDNRTIKPGQAYGVPEDAAALVKQVIDLGDYKADAVLQVHGHGHRPGGNTQIQIDPLGDLVE